MREIIEDTISRNKKFQEQRQKRLKGLKEMGAPESLIAREEMISKMTLAEFQIHCEKAEEEDKKIKLEYAKSNSIQQSIVDEIYSRESKLEYQFLTYSSRVRFMMAIHPLSFMSEEDYDNDLYVTFLNHAQEIYRTRFDKEWEDDNK